MNTPTMPYWIQNNKIQLNEYNEYSYMYVYFNLKKTIKEHHYLLKIKTNVKNYCIFTVLDKS